MIGRVIAVGNLAQTMAVGAFACRLPTTCRAFCEVDHPSRPIWYTGPECTVAVHSCEMLPMGGEPLTFRVSGQSVVHRTIHASQLKFKLIESYSYNMATKLLLLNSLNTSHVN